MAKWSHRPNHIQDRMADQRERMPDEPRPVTKVPPQGVEDVVQCPHCGAARQGLWSTVSGGKGNPYMRCGACGTVYCFTDHKTMMRRVR